MSRVKIKTKKSAAKRFKVTATGKIIRNKAWRSHLLMKKSKQRKRRLKQKKILISSEAKQIKKLLPYSL